jgi:hypothetical protein
MGAAGIQERRELQNIWPPLAPDLERQKYFEVGFVVAFFWLLLCLPNLSIFLNLDIEMKGVRVTILVQAAYCMLEKRNDLTLFFSLNLNRM